MFLQSEESYSIELVTIGGAATLQLSNYVAKEKVDTESGNLVAYLGYSVYSALT